jgi:hypothetical protein
MNSKNTLSDIKKALKGFSQPDLIDILIKLAKKNKNTKRQLEYLLFDHADSPEFEKYVKKMIDDHIFLFSDDTYYYKYHYKHVAKFLKQLTELTDLVENLDLKIELWVYLAEQLPDKDKILNSLANHAEPVLKKIYSKINTGIKKIHPDLQFDYHERLEKTYYFIFFPSR